MYPGYSIWLGSLPINEIRSAVYGRLHGLRDLPYTERLTLLNLHSLEVRRLHFDLILCYRIVFGLVRVNKDDFFQGDRGTFERRQNGDAAFCEITLDICLFQLLYSIVCV